MNKRDKYLIVTMFVCFLFFGIYNNLKVAAIKRAAERGDVEAQVELAERYKELGTNQPKFLKSLSDQLVGGLVQNNTDSVRWYRKAAEQGHARAQNNLGVIYFFGRYSVAQNVNEGMKWICKAAEQGLSCAQASVHKTAWDCKAGRPTQKFWIPNEEFKSMKC